MTASTSAAASRVPTCEVSSTITVVSAGTGWFGSADEEPGDGVGVETGGAQLGDRLVGRCQRDHVAAGIELSARGCVQRGGLAEPGRRDERAECATLAAQGVHRARLDRHPSCLGSSAIARSTTPTSSRAPGVAASAWRPARSRSSTARCSTVDHSGGRRRSTLGASRTTSPDARNRSDTATISSVVSRPAEIAATRSTTWASPKRESPAHKPVAGSTSAANNSASPGTASRSSPRPTTRSSTPTPGSSPTAVASSCQRSRSRSGVSVASLRWRVASDARSSARIRSRFDGNANSPRASRRVSIATRAFRERPQLVAGEADHLATAVAFRAPRHPETFAQGPFEVVQEHGPGGFAPDVQRVGVERHVLAVRSAHHVRDQAVGVQLRVPRPAGAMRERRNREPVGPDPSSHPTLLLTSERGTFLQELSAVSVASTTAIDTTAEVSGVPSAHSSDTDLGHDNVTSIARTLRSRCPANRSVPLFGS